MSEPIGLPPSSPDATSGVLALLLYVLLRGLDATVLKSLQLAGADHMVNGEPDQQRSSANPAKSPSRP